MGLVKGIINERMVAYSLREYMNYLCRHTGVQVELQGKYQKFLLESVAGDGVKVFPLEVNQNMLPTEWQKGWMIERYEDYELEANRRLQTDALPIIWKQDDNPQDDIFVRYCSNHRDYYLLSEPDICVRLENTEKDLHCLELMLNSLIFHLLMVSPVTLTQTDLSWFSEHFNGRSGYYDTQFLREDKEFQTWWENPELTLD